MGRTLFDLHRVIKIVEITDGAEGQEPIKIGLQAPTHAIQTKLMILLNDAKLEAEEEAKESKLRDKFKLQSLGFTKEAVIELILKIELGQTTEEADLAPNAGTVTTESMTEEQQQAAEEHEAIKRRQERRKAALDTMAIDELQDIYADLQEKLMILTQASARWALAQLCAVVVEPEPGPDGKYAPMFTAEEKGYDGQRNTNYIGDLAPQTVDLLNEARNTFYVELSEKNIRRQAESPDFSSPGKSPRKPRGSRGGIGQIQRISPPQPSASSAAGSG